MPDIEVLDDADGYAYSSHISINNHEMEVGDLLLIFDSPAEPGVSYVEQIYGFTWGSVITHQVDGVVPAESHDVEDIAEGLDTGKMAVAYNSQQTSYYVDDDTVRRLTLYHNHYTNGWHPILLDETRNTLSTEFSSQSITFCEEMSEVIDELYRSPPKTEHEAENLREFLLESGVVESAIPSADNQPLDNFDA